jgi:hypothetical protein
MKKENKKDYNLKPKFKKGDKIIRNDNDHDSLTSKGITQYVNPYHKPYDKKSVLHIRCININEFSNFFLKSYCFEEQQHAYDIKIVDIEYDLYNVGMRKIKIKKLKEKCINQNLKKMT